jgi:UDP-2-acetamido-3-amino-2,3-dideoxy-glucuronate N-acetyltransferase
LTIPAVQVLELPLVRESRGSLSYAEYGQHLPFLPKRYFIVFDVPGGQARGGHAHRAVSQFLVCVRGSCRVDVDDGRQRDSVLLESPSRGLLIPPLIWATQRDHSADAVLLVLSSENYDPAEYIRDYGEFRRLAGVE